MPGGEDPGGGGFIPAPRLRGFGRLKGQPPRGQRVEEEAQGDVGVNAGRGRRAVGAVRENGTEGRRGPGMEAGRQGGGTGGGGGRGLGTEGVRQGGLPLHVRKTLWDKKNKKIVSLNFARFVELPEVKKCSWMDERATVVLSRNMGRSRKTNRLGGKESIC